MRAMLLCLLLAGIASPAEPPKAKPQPKPAVVVLEFTAPLTCRPCREMAPLVRQVVREGARVEKINPTKDHGAAEKYGVRSVPTFIVLTGGKETARHVGKLSLADLRKLVGLKPQPDQVISDVKKPPRKYRSVVRKKPAEKK